MLVLWATQWEVREKLWRSSLRSARELFFVIYIFRFYFWLYFYILNFYFRLDFGDFMLKYISYLTIMLGLFFLLIYWELKSVVYIKMYWQSQWDIVIVAAHLAYDYFDYSILERIFISPTSILQFLNSKSSFVLDRAADRFLMKNCYRNWIWKKVCYFELGRRHLMVHRNASLDPE